MVKVDKQTWKANYFQRLKRYIDEYSKILIVNVDNVRSKQMQQTRIALRGRGELLLGKNTMVRKAIRLFAEENEDLLELLPYVVGNIGFTFTNDDLGEIRDILTENVVAAPAKAGALAPRDVEIPAGPTGMGPEKTSFFQALNIPTKIARGLIEILSPQKVVTKGEKVGASEAALLGMMNVNPFTYGMTVQQIYDNGSVFSAEILDITNDDVIGAFLKGVSEVAAVGLAINIPNAASAPHSIANGFKNVLAIAVATDITFPQAEKAKAFLADPSAFAVAVVPTEEKKEEAAKVEEPEEESDEEMGFGLFD
jgi:large subunit ribosomal protein LP0